jgi:hypothetical protein
MRVQSGEPSVQSQRSVQLAFALALLLVLVIQAFF